MSVRRVVVKSLSLSVFAVLGLSLALDAFAAITCRSTTGARACTNELSCPVGWTKISNSCSTQTVGGSLTYISHHDKAIKCTWQEFQGSWDSEPGNGSTVPMSVAHSVEGEGNYAICSGWDETGPFPPPSASPSTPYPHTSAPYGFGKFHFQVKYQSSAPLTCDEDPNSGIGNNCIKFTDVDHKPKGGGGGVPPTPGASRACALNSPGGGTTLTYQFACADGVTVTGFLTLVPVVDGNAQTAPAFTGCNAQRAAAGACTMQLGGIPTTTVKVKGQNVTVVDAAACAAIFPAASVTNSLGTSQTQLLDAKEILFYKEVATTGFCDPTTHLPTVPGLPAAAYGRYCQSDLGLFSDNLAGNLYGNEATSTHEGFDNQLRVCPVANGTAHTADQDAEQVALRGDVTLEPQGPMNLNCSTGGNTDSGGYKVLIPDQSPLFAANIDIMPLSDAPKLEGFAPKSADLIVDSDGVSKLRLTYPTCGPTPGTGLSDAIKLKYPAATNNSNVALQLTGQLNDLGLGPVLFDGQFTIKVNGL